MSKLYRGTDFNTYLEKSGEVGFVEMVDHPIVKISGLPTVTPREVVVFESGQIGHVLSLEEDFVEILVFSNDSVSIGTRVARTRDLLKVPVGGEVLGYVLDPLGQSVYEDRPLKPPTEYKEVQADVMGIARRERVTEPLETGVTVVDLMIPLGKGQRELVLGDRQTGKTEFLLQSLLSQSRNGLICIYAGIGKRKTDIKKVEEFIKENNLEKNTLIIATNSLDPLGLIYLTPYSAMTVAEYFRDSGKDVLLIMDDLTTHAKFYREISLLGNRFPGRGSYPGDIFYTHSRVLERAGNFNTEKGVHSITCLVAAETVEGDISGYIQTNLMSITDGHIYFDTDLFSQGRRPAINFFLSVTRVGRQTQSRLRWDVNRELTTVLTLMEKASTFVHFGAELSEGVKTTLETGGRILNFFSQPMSRIIPTNLQVILFSLIWINKIEGADDEVGMRYLSGHAADMYNSNEKFRSLVDGLVSQSQDFNSLLSVTTSKADELLSFIRASDDKQEEIR